MHVSAHTALHPRISSVCWRVCERVGGRDIHCREPLFFSCGNSSLVPTTPYLVSRKSLSFLTWCTSKYPPAFPQLSQVLALSRWSSVLRPNRRCAVVGVLSTSSLGCGGFQSLSVQSVYLLVFPSLVLVRTVISFPCRSLEFSLLIELLCFHAHVARKLLFAKYISLDSPLLAPCAQA